MINLEAKQEFLVAMALLMDLTSHDPELPTLNIGIAFQAQNTRRRNLIIMVRYI